MYLERGQMGSAYVNLSKVVALVFCMLRCLLFVPMFCSGPISADPHSSATKGSSTTTSRASSGTATSTTPATTWCCR